MSDPKLNTEIKHNTNADGRNRAEKAEMNVCWDLVSINLRSDSIKLLNQGLVTNTHE